MTSLRTVPRLSVAALIIAIVLLAPVLMPASSSAAGGTSVISGTAFEDSNRNGAQDFGEPPMAAKGVVLVNGDDLSQAGYAATDAAGRYSFSSLADGRYRVDFDPTDWWAIRRSWVPTTTGSILPRRSVELAGSATVDFGWRTIVRSTVLSDPISSFTGPGGLRVDSYNDVLTARYIHDDLMAGSLVGAEASSVNIRFDFGDTPAMCAVSFSGSAGSYGDYHAAIDVPYLSWLDNGDHVLFHEYGHAWSLYYAYMVQQDASLVSYLQARGIEGDARLDSSHAWNRRELIAEDYRQLFGTASAQAMAQENLDLPPAAAVSGLRDFLATTYPQQAAPPPPAPAPPPPTPAPAPALTVSGLAMNPSPVRTAGTVSFTLSLAARVTVVIRNAQGTVVRTLLSSASRPAGEVTAMWDRKNAKGQRVKPGNYTVAVDAVDEPGANAVATRDFGVA